MVVGFGVFSAEVRAASVGNAVGVLVSALVVRSGL